ncbi:nucleotidyltransferase domain-containing protein [uncultured Brevundimonas sp.]|uniref:nucleotidyltransferase family protein n=1 Tax=uncultured Brevundimonas sp. TaxID=213418 RepID=UPI0025E5C554|nr:nucleotidyltransferase domain-containing protein [uncultured Brevundimonas sp.]
MRSRDQVVEFLRGHEADLRSQGISGLYLFGSVARGDAGPASDIDLAFAVAEEMELRFSLIDQARIKRELGEALAAKVDFVELAYLRPGIRERVRQDLITIF